MDDDGNASGYQIYAEVIQGYDRKITLQEVMDIETLTREGGFDDFGENNFIVAKDAVYLIDTEKKSFPPLGQRIGGWLSCFWKLGRYPLTSEAREWLEQYVADYNNKDTSKTEKEVLSNMKSHIIPNLKEFLKKRTSVNVNLEITFDRTTRKPTKIVKIGEDPYTGDHPADKFRFKKIINLPHWK